MPKIIDLEQGTPEWKEWRRWKIGASMAPVIMGVSPFQTKMQLWESIVFGEDKEANFAMKRGTRMEEKARQWINNRKMIGSPYQPKCLQHDAIPWMIASMDGMALTWLSGVEIKEICEIKCPGAEAHLMALSGKVPDYYMPQLQHQMVVADLEEILYVSFDGEEGIEIVVPRDDEYITKQLMPQEAAFYQSLLDFAPPEMSDKDVEQIDDPEAIAVAFEYKRCLDKLAFLEKDAKNLKEKLISYAKHSRVSIGDLKLTKVIRKGSIQYDKIQELSRVDLEKYRKEPVVSWRIT